MAYIDCDKCSHGKVCAYRHQHDDHIVTCSHWKPVAEARKLTHHKIVSELDGADVFLRGRATSKTASLNEYDIEVLLGIANVCDEAADFIQRQKAEIERLNSCVKTEEEVRTIAESVIKSKIDFIKSEAIKEFADRLKKYFKKPFYYNSKYAVVQINKLVKEMTEEAHYEIRKDLADL